ncbi:MAG TPA: S8/S53 family peptidase [Thermoanaerobaculia bacterium]|jgi:hypothetical protein
MRTSRLVSALLAVCCAVAAAGQEVRPGIHFDRRFLVATRGVQAREGLPAFVPKAPAGWTLRTIVTTDVPGTFTIDGRQSTYAAPKTWHVLEPAAATLDAAAASMHPWDLAHHIVAGTAPGAMATMLDPGLIDTGMIEELEPNVAHVEPSLARRMGEALTRRGSSAKTCPDAPQGTVVACGAASFHWPNIPRVDWHQANDFTQLAAARKRTEAAFAAGPRVRIAHLDTGYYKTNDTITPPFFLFDKSKSMIPNDRCGQTGIDCYMGGLPNGHGPETLSVLAGGKINFAAADGYPAYDDYLGGAPLAEVFTYRVSPSVVLLWPLYVSEGIFSAVDENKADVISMSMGGAPSFMLRDAVNHAYDHGTAMFFAAADFFRLPVPFLPIEIPWHTMVYPARFTPATPVSGMTASKRSYGLTNSWWTLFRGDFTSWALRGSYGPARLAKGRALTATTPNITSRHGTSAFVPNQIQFSFSGTSAATPQAAAAAALWLQAHRNDIPADQWQTWRKTQLVYDALTSTAVCPQKHRCEELFGAGLIQANAAIDELPANPVKRDPAKIGVDWITLLAKIIGVNPNDPPPTGHRAELHRKMLQLEVAQLIASDRELNAMLGGDHESKPDAATLERLARALERHPRASAHLRRSVAARGR